MKLLFASRNLGKLRELERLFADLDGFFEVVGFVQNRSAGQDRAVHALPDRNPERPEQDQGDGG